MYNDAKFISCRFYVQMFLRKQKTFYVEYCVERVREFPEWCFVE